jgi:negative regulator of sigma E activity
MCGVHWASLLRLLPLYHSVSRVTLGDGTTTTFWLDGWLTDGFLAVSMLELYSHYTLQCVTVRQVFVDGLDAFLVPRPSTFASS